MKLAMKEQNSSPMLYEITRWTAFSTHLFHCYLHFFTQKLTQLHLYRNRIRDNGVEHLANALGKNKVNHIFCLLLLFISVFLHTDTHRTSSWLESNPRWRSKTSRRCFKKQHGKVLFVTLSMPLSSFLFYTDTHQTRHRWKSNQRQRRKWSPHGCAT